MAKIDMITVEVIGNRLKAIAELMGNVLVKSSFSANIKERRDCSTAIFDGKGRLVAQAEHIPLHLGSMIGIVKEVINCFYKNINTGDVFISNDPFSGGTHLPDITIITPFFKNKRVVNFVANIAHHSDIGGAQAGGISGNARTIYEEGLRIPPSKLVRKGVVNSELLNMIITNCRIPEERNNDLLAQIATNNVGIYHLEKLYKRYNDITLIKSMGKLISYIERRLKCKIKQIPNGKYYFEDKLDDDGISQEPVPIKVCIEVSNDKLKIDFSGTGKQSKGALNVVRSALIATVYYVIKAFLDPQLPTNAGFEKVISIVAPVGSIVNPKEPAAVGARTDTCQRIAGVLIGALNQAIPEKAVAGSNDASTAVVFSKEKKFVYVEAVGGGSGASSVGDGLDGVQVHITNTSNLPIEALEAEFPLRIEKYEFIPNSGGKGKFRGGLGLIREIRVLEDDILFSSHADRHKFPPWGWDGGREGMRGRFLLNGNKDIPSKSSGLILKKNDIISIKTPGGGGFGNLKERSKNLIKMDIRDEKIITEP
jgi:N-methylhydantoinase B